MKDLLQLISIAIVTVALLFAVVFGLAGVGLHIVHCADEPAEIACRTELAECREAVRESTEATKKASAVIDRCKDLAQRVARAQQEAETE